MTRQAQVQLALETIVDATLGMQGVTEAVEVTATASLIDRETATHQERRLVEQILALPVGQEYRDLSS